MQPSRVSCVRETIAVGSEEDDDDDEGAGGNLLGHENRVKQDEMVSSEQVSMDVQEGMFRYI